MPNQNNFLSDVTQITEPTFTASRIVQFPTDSILLDEIPASFAYDPEDTIELHFYTVSENALLLSTVIKLTDDIIKSHIVQYTTGYKNYIRIDFTKLFVDKELLLVPGDYRMVLNFFSDEIGSYDNRKLSLRAINNTRDEVELEFNDTTDSGMVTENINLIKEFVEKSFNKPDAVGLAQTIFTGGRIVTDQSPEDGIVAINIIENIDVPDINQTSENTIDRISRINQLDNFETALSEFLIELFPFIKEEIIKGDDRIQESEFKDIITMVILDNLNLLQEKLVPQIQIS